MSWEGRIEDSIVTVVEYMRKFAIIADTAFPRIEVSARRKQVEGMHVATLVTPLAMALPPVFAHLLDGFLCPIVRPGAKRWI